MSGPTPSKPVDLDAAQAELAMQMSLADFIAPLFEDGQRIEVLVEVGCEDGTVRTVKLEASLVKSWWARMRAQYSGSKP